MIQQGAAIDASAVELRGIDVETLGVGEMTASLKGADGLVIAVNGQIPDGEDLSWLWDVRFEHFEDVAVVAAGERATDLGVRLLYAGSQHTTIADPLQAIASCPPGRVEVLANYTAFRDLGRALARETKDV